MELTCDINRIMRVGCFLRESLFRFRSLRLRLHTRRRDPGNLRRTLRDLPNRRTVNAVEVQVH
jgi:hypothetical protein